MHVWNVLQCTRLAGNTVRKNSPSGYRRNWGMYWQWEKKLLNSNISSTWPQYGELRSTNDWDLLASLGHPSKFQPISRLGFVTAPTSLNFARCLAVSWTCTYTFSMALASWEFCQVQNSLYVQVLRSPILAELLHGTAAGVSQTFRRGTRNGITKLSQRAPPVYGRLSRWASAHILVFKCEESQIWRMIILRG